MRRSLLIGMLLVCWVLPAASASASAGGDDDGDRFVLVGSVLVDRDETAGDVVVVSGRATLGRRGRVAGDLVYGDDTPVRAPGSRVGGDVEKFAIGDVSVVGAIGLWIGFTVSLLLLGLVLLLLAPRAGEAVARTGREKPLIAALVGLLPR